MVQQLSQLRAEAAMDGADAFVQKSRAMAAELQNLKAASQGAGDAMSQNDVRVVNATNAFDRYRLRVDAVAKAESDLEKAKRAATSAVDRGRTTQEQANSVLLAYQARVDAAKQKQGEMVGSTAAVTQGFALNRQGMMELQAAGVNAFQALAAGMSPWRVAQMEAAQVLGAMVQGTQGFLSFALNPWVLGLTAAAAVTTAVALSVRSAREEQRQYEVALQSTGNANRISTDQLKDYVETLRVAGYSSTEARSAVVGALHDISAASSTSLKRATQDAADFSAAYGKPIADAEKSLLQMATGGAAAILKLDQALNFLTPAQAEVIRQLGMQGKSAEAADIAFAALEGRIAGANDKLNAQTGLLTSLRHSWEDFVNFMSGMGPLGEKQLDALAERIQSLRNDLNMGGSAERRAGLEKQIHDMSAPFYNAGTAYGGSFADFTSALSAPSPTEAASRKYLQEQIALYNQLTPALQANAGARALVQARIAAETEAMEHNLSPADREALISLRISEAKAKMAQSANDNYRQILAETEGSKALSVAYGQGTDAVIRAEAATQAHSAALANSAVNVDKLTAALIAQKKAQLDAAAAQELASQKLQTQVAWAKAQAAQISDPQAQHDAELAIARQERLNELTDKYGDNTQRINELMAEFDSQQRASDTERFWKDATSAARGYADDVKGYLLDALTGVNNKGKSIFQDLWDAALAGLKRFLINAALTAGENAIVIPMLTQVIGASPSTFGINAIAGGGGATGPLGGGGLNLGSLSSLGNIGSLLSWNSTIGNSLVTGSVGQWLGLSSMPASGFGPVSVTGLGQSLAGIGNFLGSGGVGYGIGSLWGSLGLGNATGSSIGGAIGGAVGSIIPGVGTILGSLAGSALGGLFGNSQPSDKFAETNVDLAKGTLYAPVYNPSEADQTNISASQALSQQFLTLEQQILALTGGTAPAEAFAKVGSRDGIVVGVGQAGIGVNTRNLGMTASFANTDQGAKDALSFMVEAFVKQLKGVTDENIQKVIAHGGTGEELLANLQLVQQINSLTASNDNQVVDAIAAINAQFDKLVSQAKNLGIATGALETERQKEIAATLAQADATRASYESQIRSSADQFFNAQLTPLVNFRDSVLNSGSLSALDPQQQFLAAQSAFRGLDPANASASDLVSAGQAYLQQAQAYGASGAIYQQAFGEVYSEISARISDLQKVQADAQASLGVTFKTSIADQTSAFLAGLQDLGDKLDAIKKAIAKAA